MSATREVIFLFGAGASVDARIPDTYRFVEEFESYLRREHPELSEPLSKIKKVCTSFNGKSCGPDEHKVDIEQLLGIIRRLTERKKDLLLEFYESKFVLEYDSKVFSELAKHLEDFIREQVIAKEENLTYLQELLNFDTPLEIYSTNYDTCIEQLSYRNHLRYTDGFDVTWNKSNFEKKCDIMHYKMHGSIIWYTNTKTQECMKIPVRAVSEQGKTVHLRLIYGEEVKPLLLYPAQKPEYMEPLSDLQLMFKERLFNKDTKVVVIVGYSLRDNYIVNMLWDAARANGDLHIVIIAPNAYDIFNKRLKFITKDSLSRVHDRVICLSHPFATVLPDLKNHILRNLAQLCNKERENIKNERDRGYANWREALQLAIDCEYLTQAENIAQKISDNWDIESAYSRQNWLVYAFKGLLTSIINNVNASPWIMRVNKTLERINAENFFFQAGNDPTFRPVFRFYSDSGSYSEVEAKAILEYWIDPCFQELIRRNNLLGPDFERRLEPLNNNLSKLDRLAGYLKPLISTYSWDKYLDLRQKYATTISPKLALARSTSNWQELKAAAEMIEREILKETLGSNIVQFSRWLIT